MDGVKKVPQTCLNQVNIFGGMLVHLGTHFGTKIFPKAATMNNYTRKKRKFEGSLGPRGDPNGVPAVCAKPPLAV